MATVWYVYMLECAGDRIYTGVTPDVARRFALHCRGAGAAFTRAHPPRRVLAARRCADRSRALKLEYALKQLPRADKLVWAARYSCGAGSGRPDSTVSARLERNSG